MPSLITLFVASTPFSVATTFSVELPTSTDDSTASVDAVVVFIPSKSPAKSDSMPSVLSSSVSLLME